MRRYNFPVSFTHYERPGVICSVRLNTRFNAQEMLEDFPQNMTKFYLEDLIDSDHKINYTSTSENSIEISLYSGEIRDFERAILLNLMDFGQDFENDRSTTIEEVTLFVASPEEFSLGILHQALNNKISEFRDKLSYAMASSPPDPDDPYIAKTWPNSNHHRYQYSLFWKFSQSIPDEVVARSDKIHRLVMWNAFSTTMTSKEAVEGRYTGVAYECFSDGSEFEYAVERPSCDPAMAIYYLLDYMENDFSLFPISNKIKISEE